MIEQGESSSKVAAKATSHEVRGEGRIQSAQIEELQTRPAHEEKRALTEKLMERVCEKANLNQAYRKVKANKGACGIDRMNTEDLLGWLKTNGENLRRDLLVGRYRPQPVRGVDIPKPGGGVRQLGIPTVVDRFVQQAILQVLTPILDPSFSEHSYGFRPKRSAHDALKKAAEYVAKGNEIVVDMDLEKFFDRVNHDILMARLARRIADKPLLRLIRRYLEAGIMKDGVCVEREEGTPQGGPLSPLLANLLLDDLDKELEKRGHRFCRYADDCNIYVHSIKAGERVMESITRFLETRLKLKVNCEKSAVAPTKERKFLGHRIEEGGRLTIAPSSIERMKGRVRELTGRTRGRALKSIIWELNQYLRGWVPYYRHADARRQLRPLDQWVRRKLRCYRLKQRKRRWSIVQWLIELGITREAAWSVCRGNRWWRMSRQPRVQQAMNTKWFKELGLVNLEERFLALQSG